MEYLLSFIEKSTGLSSSIQINLFLTLIIFFTLWSLKKIITLIINHRFNDIRVQYVWRKTISYIFYFIIILIFIKIWFKGFTSIETFLGLLSAGIAIALKDLLINITGWFFIVIRKPFIAGDRIQINKIAGDVIDIRLFQFTVLEIGNWVDADQSTGRIIHVPNGKIFIDEIANYTQDFKYIWNEIPVLLTFESNWKKAKKILYNIINNLPENLTESMKKDLKNASKKYMIYYKELNPIVYTTVKENGILLTIRYICNPRYRRGSEQYIWEHILNIFSKEDGMDFAYPTIRYFNNFREGKKPKKKKNK